MGTGGDSTLLTASNPPANGETPATLRGLRPIGAPRFELGTSPTRIMPGRQLPRQESPANAGVSGFRPFAGPGSEARFRADSGGFGQWEGSTAQWRGREALGRERRERRRCGCVDLGAERAHRVVVRRRIVGVLDRQNDDQGNLREAVGSEEDAVPDDGFEHPRRLSPDAGLRDMGADGDAPCARPSDRWWSWRVPAWPGGRHRPWAFRGATGLLLQARVLARPRR